MTTPEIPSPPRRRRLRYFLITLATFAVTVALFYAEEDWRGWRALEQARRELMAQGVNLDWKSYLPAPVPEDENVFGVPEMQEWFTGRGSRKGLADKLTYPGWNSAERMVVAQLTIGLPGATPPVGSAVLQWGSKTKDETIRLIKEAVGSVALDPGYPYYTKQPPGEIRPVQIFLQCQTQPDAKDLLKFLPDSIFNQGDGYHEKVKIENTGNGAYNVTMQTPSTAVEYLKWSKESEPMLSLISNALQRPYARMQGDYSEPSHIPIPNFVSIRIIAQRLGAMAQCHLLLGQPEEALGNLTLTHDICRRVLEENQPMTLISAMINVAVRGLDAGIIADGLKLHAWREPQLAALEEQLKAINILPPVQQSFKLERMFLWYRLATRTPAELAKLYHSSDLDSGPAKGHGDAHSWRDKINSFIKEWKDSWFLRLIPRGWFYQNAVTGINLYTHTVTCLDPARQLVFPDKANAAHKQTDTVFSHWSPYTFLTSIMIPNFIRASQTTAKNQTMINQARIACALERYHLAHNEYPESLDALVPQLIDEIPHDLIGGQPPHYRRNSDGTFLLYSIGWSQQDHGGHGGNKDDSDLVWPDENK